MELIKQRNSSLLKDFHLWLDLTFEQVGIYVRNIKSIRCTNLKKMDENTFFTHIDEML